MILVIIIDGATFKLIKPWIRMGRLPTFEKLIKNGVHGELKSTVPPQTCPAIPAFYTGKNPGKLGLFGFTKEDGSLVNSTDINGEPVWKVLNESGIKTCIINLPTTYPPEKINGVMITGAFTPSKDVEYTYPTELRDKIGDYPIVVKWESDWSKVLNKSWMLEKQVQITRKRFATLEKILKKNGYGFSIFFVKGTDILQHLFWNEKSIMQKYYETIDSLVGHLIGSQKIENVIILSDHGFDSSPTRYFYVNTFLEKSGYLKMKGGTLRKWIMFKTLPLRRPIPLKVRKALAKISHTSLGKKGSEKFVPGVSWVLGVNWIETVAYLDRVNGIKITEGKKVQGEECEKIKDEIIEKFKELKDEKGEDVIKEVARREETYSGEYLINLPEIIFVTDEKYLPIGRLTNRVFAEIPKRERKGSGSHFSSRNGIFIVYGLNIEKEQRIEGAEIIDITPTILHMMNVPIPKDMDGRVLKEIFKKGTEPAVRKVMYREPIREKRKERMVWSKEEEERVRERLRRLGYLD